MASPPRPALRPPPGPPIRTVRAPDLAFKPDDWAKAYPTGLANSTNALAFWAAQGGPGRPAGSLRAAPLPG